MFKSDNCSSIIGDHLGLTASASVMMWILPVHALSQDQVTHIHVPMIARTHGHSIIKGGDKAFLTMTTFMFLRQGLQ